MVFRQLFKKRADESNSIEMFHVVADCYKKMFVHNLNFLRKINMTNLRPKALYQGIISMKSVRERIILAVRNGDKCNFIYLWIRDTGWNCIIFYLVRLLPYETFGKSNKIAGKAIKSKINNR